MLVVLSVEDVTYVIVIIQDRNLLYDQSSAKPNLYGLQGKEH